MIMMKKSLFAGAMALAIGAVATISATPAIAKDKGETAKVGEKAPDFTLTDINGKEHTLSDYTDDGKIVVLEWFNPMCPFVVKHHEKMSTMSDLAEKYSEEGVVWIAINSAHPGHMTYANNSACLEVVKEWEIEWPMLVDESGTVGRMYGARTTPNMYIIDTDRVLRYAGAIDSDSGAAAYDAGKKDKVVNYVDRALTQVINGETVTQAETKPYGCSVKYKK